MHTTLTKEEKRVGDAASVVLPLLADQVAASKTSLLASIAADSRMKARDKCEMYRELAYRSNVLTPDAYPLTGDGACAAYPIAEYPWDTSAVAARE